MYAIRSYYEWTSARLGNSLANPFIGDTQHDLDSLLDSIGTHISKQLDGVRIALVASQPDELLHTGTERLV